jgi:transposase InsO family protein
MGDQDTIKLGAPSTKGSKMTENDARSGTDSRPEVIHRRGPWRNFEAVEFATLEWIDWFNHRRLLEPIGNIPPAEAEEQYHARLDEAAIAA